MYLIMCFLLGIVFPFLFIKANSKALKWIPAIILLIGTIFMGVKARFFLAADMAVLGDIMYSLILGAATFGSFIGAVLVGVLKKN